MQRRDLTDNRPHLEAGNYVGTVVELEYVPIDPSTGKGDYINVTWDITEGPLTGYAQSIYADYSFWPLTMSITLKGNAWKFNSFIKALEGYDYDAHCNGDDWDEHSVEGCDFGISIQMEHYIGKDDTEKTRFKRWGNHVLGSVDKARKGELKLVEDAYTDEALAIKNASDALGLDVAMAEAEADNPFA